MPSRRPRPGDPADVGSLVAACITVGLILAVWAVGTLSTTDRPLWLVAVVAGGAAGGLVALIVRQYRKRGNRP